MTDLNNSSAESVSGGTTASIVIQPLNNSAKALLCSSLKGNDATFITESRIRSCLGNEHSARLGLE